MDKSFGRGQKLQSVIKDYSYRKPSNLQDQLYKVAGNDYTNESIEKFCSELADRKVEGTYASILRRKKLIKDDHPNEFEDEVGIKSEIAGVSVFGSNSSKPKIGCSTTNSASNSGNHFDEGNAFIAKPEPHFSKYKSACSTSSENSTTTQPSPRHKNQVGIKSEITGVSSFGSNSSKPKIGCSTTSSASNSGNHFDEDNAFIAKPEPHFSKYKSACSTSNENSTTTQPSPRHKNQVGIKSEITGVSCFGSNSSKPKIGCSTTSSASNSGNHFDEDNTFIAKPEPHFSKYKSACSTSSENSTTTQPSSRHKRNLYSMGIGRGQMLRMVTESIPRGNGTLQHDIERACGTDYTNQSIERFVKELMERNGNDETS